MKMKKFFILVLALAASAGTVFAQSGTCGKDGDNLTWTLSGGTLTISGTGAMADWTTFPDIPWYSNCSSIKSVVIEDGVTSIGENAFAYCTNLTSVSLPNSVTSMGWCAFTDCTALTSFTISKSVTNIEGGALLGCTGLTSIIVESGNTTYDSRNNCNAIIETTTNTLIQGCKNTIIPYSVTSIGSNAFRNYTNLTSIDIPYSVTSIEYGAFDNCSGLTSITCEATEPPTCGGNCFYGVDKSIPVYVPNVDAYTAASVWSSFTNIQSLYVASGTCGKEGDGSNLTWTLSKNGVLTISGTGDMADWSNTNPWYENRSSIKSVVIEAGVTSIGKYAFYNCDNLTSVTIPGSVTSIGNYAFNKCSSLASVTIPESVISIGQRAFWNCTSLTSIELPEGIKSIGVRTFCQCTSLKSVTIPASVTNIYDEAFSGCNALTEITCKATTPPTCGGGNCFYAVTKSIPVYVPNVDAYTAASVWSSFTNIQSLYVASGTCGAEGDGSNLTWTLSKEGVLTISGTGAMTNWSSASDVPWYSKRLSITEVSIGNSVTSIGDGAFAYCTGLTSVTIGNSVTSIGAAAFYNCQKMTSITIPNSVTSIGESAFYACTGLTSVEIPNGVTTIGGFAFANCTALTSVTIPNSVIIIRNNAFFDCTALAAITIPNSVTTIEEQAFAICQALTAVTIPGSVTTIEDAAFAYCTGLTAFNVASDNPNYCSVDGVLFNKDKTNLIQYPGAKQGAYTIPNSVTEIKGYAFYKCSGLTSVTIGNSVTSIGEQALYGCSGLTSITCEAVEPPTLGDYVFLDVDKTIPLYVPAGSVDKYKAAYQWKDFDENIQEIPPLASGTCGKDGDNLKWELEPDGTLTISGTGEMKDWMWSFETPWADYLSSIKSLVINDGVTSLGNSAFENCTGLTSVTIPAGITNIGTWAFNKCSGLTSFEVAKDNPNYCAVDGVLFNKDQTMLVQYPIGNTRTEYTIPNGVTTIRQSAFGYSVLTSVTIPSSVTDVDPSAFYKCTGLTSITCEATTPPTCGDNCFNEVDKTIPLYVPKGTVEAYKDPSANGWKDFNNIQEIGGGTGIEQITNDQSQMTNGKSFSNGQLLILRDGKVYTVTGQEVR